MVIEVRRQRRERAADPYQVFVEPLEEYAEFLGRLRDHVQRFEDGHLSLEEFLEGPGSGDAGDDEPEELACDCPDCQRFRADPLAAIAELLAEVEMREQSRPRRPSPQGRRASSRKDKRKQRKKSRRKKRR